LSRIIYGRYKQSIGVDLKDEALNNSELLEFSIAHCMQDKSNNPAEDEKTVDG